MRGVDLSLFQFDWDVTFAAVLLNGDGTVYGRFGTRSGRGDQASRDVSLPGFREALEGALEIHAGYPGNREALRGKEGEKLPFRFPEQIPALRERKSEDLPKGCIHCHEVAEGLRTAARATRRPLPDDLMYPWPLPDRVGLVLDPDTRATVKSVAPGSPAARSGIAPRDRVLAVVGQPVLSAADVQWALHKAPAEGTLRVLLAKPDGKEAEASLALEAGWRRGDVAWRGSFWPARPGFTCDPLDAAGKQALGIPPDGLALRVKFVYRQDSGKAARKAGLEAGDVLVEVDGRRESMDETAFLAHVLQGKVAGQSLSVTVLRKGKLERLRLPLQ